jgi:hypothetical protein
VANFDAGTIEATLRLDRTPFSATLRQAKAEGRDFDIKGRLGLDDREFEKGRKKVDAAKAKIERDKIEVPVGLDADELEREMRKTFAEVDAQLTKGKDLQIEADLNKAKVDRKIAQIVAELKGIQDEKVEVDVESDSVVLATRRVGLLTTALLGLSPALVPAIGGLTAATAGLLAPLSAATVGIGAFGLAGFAAAKDAASMYGEITKLEEKLEQTTDAAQRAQIIGELEGIYKNLTPAQQDFVESLGEVSSAFGRLGAETSGGVLPLLTRGLDTVAAAMVPLPGLVRAVTPAFDQWFDGIDRWVRGPGYRGFLTFFAQNAPVALEDFGRILGGLLRTVGSLTVAFSPLGRDIFGGLADGAERLADATARMATTQGFQDFIAYVREQGPEVLRTIGAIAESFVDIGVALAPLGGPTLVILRVLADSISALAETAPELLQVAVVLGVAGRALVAFGDAGAAMQSKLGNIRSTVTNVSTTFSKLRGAASGLVGVLGGPWGIALGAAAVGLTLLAQRSAESSAAQDGLRDSLDQVTGALTRQSQEAAVNALRQEGAIDAAKRLGIPLDLVRKASLGNVSATRELNARLNELGRTAGAAGGPHSQLAVDILTVASATDKSRESIDDQRRIIDENNEALGRGVKSADGLTFATKQEAAAHDRATAKIREHTRSLEQDIAKMRESRDAALGLSGGMIGVEQAIDDANKTIRDNGANLDINTQKGRDNQAALDTLAAEYASLGDSVAFQNLTTKEQIAYQERVRRAFINSAVQAGLTKKEARELATQYGLTPETIKTKAELETEQQKLEDWKNGLKDTPKSVTTKGKFNPDKESVFDWINRVTPGRKGAPPIFVKTEGRLSPSAKALEKWKADLKATPKETNTKGKVDPETNKQRGWLSLLDKTPKEKNTKARVQSDEPKVHSLQRSINNLRGKTVSVRINTYRYTEYASAVRQGRRDGADGGIFHPAKGVLRGYATGGVVDLRQGGTLAGFAPGIDTELALLARGEGVLRPEVVRWLGGARTITEWNRKARAGALDGTPQAPTRDTPGRVRVGGMQNVTLNVYNPVGTPTQIELNRQAARSRMLFDLDGADDGSMG